ncbi:MAG: L-histidine N(alpha)-methyltransferase [Acidimicrobiales bacterium]
MPEPSIEIHLHEDDFRRSLYNDVTAGLTRLPKILPPKYFYDDRGSELFEEITKVEEYYPTRREREILEHEASSIARLAQADTLVELGSGTSLKTMLLLSAFHDQGLLKRFVPFDVSEATLAEAAASIADRWADVAVHAVVGDFERHLGEIPREGKRMFIFLGGTIGNLDEHDRAQFLEQLVATMNPGDSLLLGTDIVKAPARLVAAYDDSAGVTADFNLNMLRVLNRELDGDFDLAAFEHVALWNADHERIEMHLRSLREQTVHLGDLDLDVHFANGEMMRTEISCKFRRESIASELAAAGLTLQHWWTDAHGDFGLSLSTFGDA